MKVFNEYHQVEDTKEYINIYEMERKFKQQN